MTTTPRSSALTELSSFLDTLPTGPVAQLDTLRFLLTRSWETLDGASGEGMRPDKVHRMRHPVWEPPVLSFDIERHGGTVMGSTRADVQRWEVNLDAGIASPRNVSHRQLEPMAARLDVGPLADDVANLIVTGRDDPRVKWSTNRQVVTVNIGRVIPASGPAHTVQGRRKRFRAALEARVVPLGWESGGPNRFIAGDSGG